MRRMMTVLAVVLCLSEFVAAVGGETQTSAPNSFQRGDKVHLIAEKGSIPGCKSEAGYAKFLENLNAPPSKKAELFKDMWVDEAIILSNVEAYVTVTAAFPDPANRVDLASLKDASKIPAIVVKFDDWEKPIWIPAIYARTRASQPYPVERMVPEFGYEVQILTENKLGDRLRLLPASEAGVCYLSVTARGCADFFKSIAAKDQVGIEQLAEKGTIFHVELFSKLLVIDHSTANLNGEDLPVSQVRFVEGGMKEKTAWAPTMMLARVHLVVKPKPVPKPPAFDPKARAQTLLKSAENTAKNGNKKGAAEFYRQVIKDYPGSDEAKIAAEKLKAIP